MASIKHQIEDLLEARFIVISQRRTQASQSFKHIFLTYHDQEELSFLEFQIPVSLISRYVICVSIWAFINIFVNI